MTKGKKNLSYEQEAALQAAHDAYAAYRAAKVNARILAERFIADHIRQHEDNAYQKLYEAHAKGVPNRRLHMEAMGTTSPNALYAILKEIRQRQEVVGVEIPVSVTPVGFGRIYSHDGERAVFTVDAGDGHIHEVDGMEPFEGWPFIVEEDWSGKVVIANRLTIGDYPKKVVEYAESIIQQVIDGDYGLGD